MAQLTTVFCEGPHDVAFIYRMLKATSYKSFDSCKIGDLPAPFNDLIKSEVEKTDVEQLNISEVKRSLLPAKVMKKDDQYIFLYSIGSDSKAAIRKKMLRDILSFIPEPGEIRTTPVGTSFSLIYLFDADEKGLNARLNQINTEINEVLDTRGAINFTDNATFNIESQINFGVYIFTGSDDNTGTLEEILLPLMQENNEAIFEEAQTFLNNHFSDERLFKLKIKTNSTTGNLEESRSTKQKDKKYYLNSKSLIGTVGQLQDSGASNVVCINYTDCITLNKMRSNPKCIEIIDFLNRV